MMMSQLMMLANVGSDEELCVLVAWRTSSELGIVGSKEVVGCKLIVLMCASKRHG